MLAVVFILLYLTFIVLFLILSRLKKVTLFQFNLLSS